MVQKAKWYCPDCRMTFREEYRQNAPRSVCPDCKRGFRDAEAGGSFIRVYVTKPDAKGLIELDDAG